MIKQFSELPSHAKTLVTVLPLLSIIFIGAAWAVDTRIDQRTDSKIQQLRQDVKTDFRQERIDFLQMKKTANIITAEEIIELDYLLTR